MKPKPKTKTHQQPMIGTMRLELAIDMDHELVRLAQTINWDAMATEFRPMHCPNNGRPAVPTRLMAGLQLLKHTFNLSDEQVVTRWTENPYWQFFCGEEFLSVSPWGYRDIKKSPPRASDPSLPDDVLAAANRREGCSAAS